MSRNDPEITWVKMCRTSQFMNWRHEMKKTERQDLWIHCHDLRDGSPRLQGGKSLTGKRKTVGIMSLSEMLYWRV